VRSVSRFVDVSQLAIEWQPRPGYIGDIPRAQKQELAKDSFRSSPVGQTRRLCLLAERQKPLLENVLSIDEDRRQ